ncbi:unnamed protein product [Bemisia tabaci]|uniref:Uncharacterized protein n=1 Tax=Bemisia tabaci TaxID=7038 RepID=A0A9P0API0_BEMTA|nr:unnamed protein product [Bemisia tabaci]
MYSVVAHQSYGRGDRRQRGQQQSGGGQQGQQQGQQDGKDGEASRRRRAKHRLSLTAKIINYIRRRFNNVEDAADGARGFKASLYVQLTRSACNVGCRQF